MTGSTTANVTTDRAVIRLTMRGVDLDVADRLVTGNPALAVEFAQRSARRSERTVRSAAAVLVGLPIAEMYDAGRMGDLSRILADDLRPVMTAAAYDLTCRTINAWWTGKALGVIR